MANKILVIGLSCVGDVVMTSPVFESLHEHYPQKKMDVVADNRSKQLYLNCPYVDKVFIKDKNRFLRGTPALIAELWSTHYDIVVDLRTDFLSHLLKANTRFTKRKSRSYGNHAVEETMGVIAGLHGDKPIPATKVWLAPEDKHYAEETLSGFDKNACLLAVSVGDPSKPFKNWTIEKTAALINKHADNFSGLVFVGGPDEVPGTDELIKEIDMPYINTVGNSLLEAAAILERCKVYIGPDSGLGHLASAVNTATISFFSSVSPVRYQPWGNQSVAIVGDNKDARNIPLQEVESALSKLVI